MKKILSVFLMLAILILPVGVASSFADGGEKDNISFVILMDKGVPVHFNFDKYEKDIARYLGGKFTREQTLNILKYIYNNALDIAGPIMKSRVCNRATVTINFQSELWKFYSEPKNFLPLDIKIDSHLD